MTKSPPESLTDQIATAAEAEEAQALPRMYEAHADRNRPVPDPEGCLPKTLSKPAANKSPARWAYERLILYIRSFESQLDASHEAGFGFTGSDAGVIRIEGMGYYDPDIITFYGADESGAKTQLIQHVSQLSVLLRAVEKPSDAPKATRIGFRLAEALEEDEINPS